MAGLSEEDMKLILGDRNVEKPSAQILAANTTVSHPNTSGDASIANASSSREILAKMSGGWFRLWAAASVVWIIFFGVADYLSNLEPIRDPTERPRLISEEMAQERDRAAFIRNLGRATWIFGVPVLAPFVIFIVFWIQAGFERDRRNSN